MSGKGGKSDVSSGNGPHQSQETTPLGRITAEECVEISGDVLRKVYANWEGLTRRQNRGASTTFKGVNTVLRALEMVDG